MKNKNVDFHMERKRTLAVMFFFALLLSVIGMFAIVTIGTDCANLSSLLRSDYSYSVIASNLVFKDNYYKFDAGINFMLSEDAKSSINCEVLMQSADSDYTDSVDWNPKELSKYGVAVTEGIAKKNGIKIDDKLYSKHIADGTVHEYRVEQILPELTSTRITDARGSTNGIIVMGYDSSYTENFVHKSLIFTENSIEDLTIMISGTPESIVYRSDEILSVAIKLLPYLLLFTLIYVLLVITLIFIITKEVKYNFKRLIILGFKKSELNSAYNGLAYTIGISAIVAATVIDTAVSQFFVFSLVEAAFLLALMFIGMVTLWVSARLSIRQLWR